MSRPSMASRLGLLLLLFVSFASVALASSPASFCKCTCFSNSTIIPLDPQKGDVTSLNSLFHRNLVNGDANHSHETRADNYRSLSCNDCNRKFCLGYDLPMCKGAKEEDVFTTCFQRDSRKDEAIVFIFIIATGSLLAWAVFKPWVEKYLEAARERRSYMPVSEHGGRLP
ncbi:hypothetical protein BJX96DRAFT_159839 [Aspergillus floccosus]